MGGKAEIALIAVASLQPYHGYERVLAGIKDYYEMWDKPLIRFIIVGDGESRNDLERLVKAYRLEEYVTFTGAKSGIDLDEQYDLADIALGSFGLYKRGTCHSSALKTRDYIARGFPVVSGCFEDVFHLHPSMYYKEFSNDSRPIDINEILKFYARITKKQSIYDIRETLNN